MPRIKVQRPEAKDVQANSRAFALLHQLDPTNEGVDSEVRLSCDKRCVCG